ncbi:hypothetical protein ABZW03_38475, partial [Kitasatospora sp. NPDC004799]|uniref:hypothetical protein n=1 Tax=Kitasatospora sp. NPDC004799 TaxID=3154460 RepID=UPI0033B5F358
MPTRAATPAATSPESSQAALVTAATTAAVSAIAVQITRIGHIRYMIWNGPVIRTAAGCGVCRWALAAASPAQQTSPPSRPAARSRPGRAGGGSGGSRHNLEAGPPDSSRRL